MRSPEAVLQRFSSCISGFYNYSEFGKMNFFSKPVPASQTVPVESENRSLDKIPFKGFVIAYIVGCVQSCSPFGCVAAEFHCGFFNDAQNSGYHRYYCTS